MFITDVRYFEVKNMKKTNNISIIKRRRELKRKITLFCLLTVVTVILAVLFVFGSKSVASDGSVKDYNKYYKSIEISGDDSLYELASRYSVPDLMSEEEFITEVMFINNMESDKLSYGKSFIIIPYYS